jgi:hypothetical protein
MYPGPRRGDSARAGGSEKRRAPDSSTTRSETGIRHRLLSGFASVVTSLRPSALDVAVHEAAGFGLRKRVAHLAEQVDRPLGRHGPVALHKPVEIEAVEQFHHIIESAIVGDAEVPELYGVRGTKLRRDLGFAFESAQHLAGRLAGAGD